MLEDVAYKLSRKLLPESLYRRASRSFLGRDKAWRRIETYAATFEFYRGQASGYSGRIVAEVGCGNQYFTALMFLADGASQVLLIEPSFEPGAAKLAEELRGYNLKSGKSVRIEDVQARIHCYRDLSEVPPEFDARVDLAFSYLVLEHFSDLESFFRHTARLLKAKGSSINFVDLSDHTYHLLAKYGFSRDLAVRRFLYHLRYSDRLFNLLNDPKCYMNRVLLPAYLDLAGKYRLRVAKLEKRIDEAAVLHHQRPIHLGGEIDVVRGDQRCKTFRAHKVHQRIEHAAGRARIKIAGRFVGQNDGRAIHESACDGDALALTSGKVLAVLARAGLIPILKPHDFIVNAGESCGSNDVGERCTRPCEANGIEQSGLGEEHSAVLRHACANTLQLAQRPLPHVMPANIHRAILRVIEPVDQFQQRRLSAARATDEANFLSRFDIKIDSVQDGFAVAIAEFDVTEFQINLLGDRYWQCCRSICNRRTR